MARRNPLFLHFLALGGRWAPLFALTLLFISGCDSKPTDSDGEAVLKTHVSQHLPGLMELAGFTKTDCQSADEDGKKVYHIDYDGELRVLQLCTFGGADGDLTALAGSMQSASEQSFNAASASNVAHPGDILKIHGQLSLEKTDSGWKLASARMKPTALVRAAVSPPSAFVAKSSSDEGSGANNIFGIGSTRHPSSGNLPDKPAPASPAIVHPPEHIETVVAPPPVPVVPAGPTLQSARAKLDAEMAAVEHSLANNPAYRAAKAKADEAASEVEKARANAGPGSPEVTEAAQKSLEAKAKLKEIVVAAGRKSKSYLEAEHEFEAAGGSHSHSTGAGGR